MSYKTAAEAAEPLTETIVPTHVGLILDGNRRWAREQGLPTLQGHKKGYENLKTVADAAFGRGVKYLSAFVFSTENWKRSKEEVGYLMELLFWVATHEVVEMDRKNIRLKFIGRPEGLSKKILKAIEAAEAKTAKNTGGTLGLCLNYGGHWEIADAAAKMLAEGVDPKAVTPEVFAKYLYAPELPMIDLMIRTSGEQRLSGFMLYRMEYAEMLFVEKHWPAFTPADLDEALAVYAGRQRRFGK